MKWEGRSCLVPELVEKGGSVGVPGVGEETEDGEGFGRRTGSGGFEVGVNIAKG